MRHEGNGSVRRAPSAYVYGGARRQGWPLRSAAAAGTALVAGAVIGALIGAGERRARMSRRTRAARRMHQGAAILSLSVLADSALEHQRASFENRAMYVAPSVSGAALANSLRAARVPARHGALQASVYATAAATGLAGAGFHAYNLLKRTSALHRPGGSFSWLNLFYAAPLAAPLAIAVAGVLGFAAEQVAQGAETRRWLGMKPERALGLLTSVGLLGNSAEVGLLHFRGAFQNPFMYVPLAVPPLAAASLAASALRPSPALRRVARVLLGATAAVGLAGVGFHLYGIQRNMGGFGNWRQMIMQGPPVPAPPAFTGLALAGMGMLDLQEAAHERA